MGYENRTPVKTICLPIKPNVELSLDDYKAQYGIDLKPYIHLGGGLIQFFVPNAKVLISIIDQDESLRDNNIPSSVFEASIVAQTKYVEGTDEGNLILGTKNTADDYFGINFKVNSSSEFTLDNVRIFSAF